MSALSKVIHNFKENSPNLGVNHHLKVVRHADLHSHAECISLCPLRMGQVPILHLGLVRLWFKETVLDVSTPALYLRSVLGNGSTTGTSFTGSNGSLWRYDSVPWLNCR